MRALILSAGLGTRLRPYTDYTPKPLFTISGRPLLDIMITQLIQAGCESAIINTHHLHTQIEAFIAQQNYAIPIQTRYEAKILGTGGAILNVRDFWNERPFMVVNADIVTSIDFKAVYRFHCQHKYPVTLVLVDDPEFNSVITDADGFVTEFHQPSAASGRSAQSALTFTGIQVLDPEILQFISRRMPASSIDAYARLIAKGEKIKSYISPGGAYWKDIGTPERYQAAVFETLMPRTYQQVFPGIPIQAASREHLKGDGSDRRWYRLKMGRQSMILVDHGIKKSDRTTEADAFVSIGRHLFDRGVPVPQIYETETFAGYVFLEDMGSTDLQTAVQQADSVEQIVTLYRKVIDQLIKFSTAGADQFDTAWCHQTAHYSKALILEKECRYFIDAFLNTYLGLNIRFADLKKEFEFLAENAVRHAVQGLMHRDFQSRNIMIKNEKIFFIDFQGARMGPLQYDLAALLIDPYVGLLPDVQARLLAYALIKLQKQMQLTADHFKHGYRFCCLTRNLQILGAFGYLSRVKRKAHFEPYIPAAVKTLRHNLKHHADGKLPKLNALMDKIVELDQIRNPILNDI